MPHDHELLQNDLSFHMPAYTNPLWTDYYYSSIILWKCIS